MGLRCSRSVTAATGFAPDEASRTLSNRQRAAALELPRVVPAVEQPPVEGPTVGEVDAY